MPAYAQDMLWLTAKDFAHQLGKSSKIQFPEVSTDEPLMLRWGHETGSPITQWQTPQNTYAWDGIVQIAGHIDAIHVWDEENLLLVELRGGLHDAMPLPTLSQLQKPLSREIGYVNGHDWYAFALEAETLSAELLTVAFGQGQAIYAKCSFAAEGAQLHTRVGLPLLGMQISLLA